MRRTIDIMIIKNQKTTTPATLIKFIVCGKHVIVQGEGQKKPKLMLKSMLNSDFSTIRNLKIMI